MDQSHETRFATTASPVSQLRGSRHSQDPATPAVPDRRATTTARQFRESWIDRPHRDSRVRAEVECSCASDAALRASARSICAATSSRARGMLRTTIEQGGLVEPRRCRQPASCRVDSRAHTRAHWPEQRRIRAPSNPTVANLGNGVTPRLEGVYPGERDEADVQPSFHQPATRTALHAFEHSECACHPAVTCLRPRVDLRSPGGGAKARQRRRWIARARSASASSIRTVKTIGTPPAGIGMPSNRAPAISSSVEGASPPKASSALRRRLSRCCQTTLSTASRCNNCTACTRRCCPRRSTRPIRCSSRRGLHGNSRSTTSRHLRWRLRPSRQYRLQAAHQSRRGRTGEAPRAASLPARRRGSCPAGTLVPVTAAACRVSRYSVNTTVASPVQVNSRWRRCSFDEWAEARCASPISSSSRAALRRHVHQARSRQAFVQLVAIIVIHLLPREAVCPARRRRVA